MEIKSKQIQISIENTLRIISDALNGFESNLEVFFTLSVFGVPKANNSQFAH